MRGYAQTVLLFLLGGTLLRLAWTGDYLRYVRDVHLPLLVLAGLALLVVAAANLWHDLRTSRLPDDTATGLRLDGFFGSERLRAALTAPTRALSAARPRRAAPPISDPERAADASEVDYHAAAGGPARPDRARARAAGWAAAEHEGLAEAGEPRVPDVVVDSPTAAYASVRPEPSTEAFIAFSAGGDVRTGGPSPAYESEEPGATGGGMVSTGSGRGTRGGWALLAVALAVLVLSPPALGTFPATRAGTVAAVGSPPPVPAGDPVPMSLVDYVTHAAAGGQALVGHRVRLVGFVMAGPRGEPYLVRLAIGCCAAGARPVKVGLTGGLPGVLTPDQWIAVVGTYTGRTDPDPVNAAPIPYLSVVEVTEIDPPADPYES